MSLGSFFTRALDAVTPWDRGGEAQRRDERRRREEEEERQRRQSFNPSNAPYGSAPSFQNQNAPNQNQPLPEPEKPKNIFEDLNKNLVFNPQNLVVPVVKKPEIQTPPPKPGAVVKPKGGLPKPKPLSGLKELNQALRDGRISNSQYTVLVNALQENRYDPELIKSTYKDKPITAQDRRLVGAPALKQVRNELDEARKNRPSPGRLFVNMGREIVTRGPARIINAVSKELGTGKIDTSSDAGPLRKFLLGTEPINTLEEDVASVPVIGKPLSRTPLALPLGFLLNVPGPNPFKIAKELPEQVVKDLAKESSELVVRDVLIKNGIAEDVAARLTPELAKLKNAKDIRNKIKEADVFKDIDDAAITATANAANRDLKPRPVPVTKNIPVTQVDEGLPQLIRTRNMTEPKPLIQELAGDASIATPNPLIRRSGQEAREAAAREEVFQLNRGVQPNQRIEGVTPRTNEPFRLDDANVKIAQDKLIDDYSDFLRDIGERNGVDIAPDGRRLSNNVRFGDTGGKQMSKVAWREEAERQLRAGKAEPGVQKAFDESTNPEVQSILAEGESLPVAEGRPIKVQEAKGIPVRDETIVPQNLPETPGQVRVTEATAPSNVKSEVVAAQPAAVVLPKEVQNILDNPKQFNKRQVAAARNQRKLAKQMAKTQEQTAEALTRIEASKPSRFEGQPEGFASTGEFRVGKRGNVSESASRETEALAGTKEMADRSVDDLLDEISFKETLTPGDRRRITAAKENLMKTDPDNFRSTDKYKLLDNLEKAGRSDLGRGLALIPRTIRKSATSDALTARWERKVGNVLDDPSKMTDVQWRQVQDANDAFTTARNRAGAFEEQFRRTGSEADFKAWEQAHKAARDADVTAKMTEVKVAQQILKGEKGADVTKTIDSLKKEADVNTMDLVTANMLSGTGTGFRNTFGTELAGIENRLFANTRAKITGAIFKENVGGYSSKGARYGRKFGAGKWVDDIKRRAAVGGKNPLEWAKNWSTTINSAGESSLQSQVFSRLGKYYKKQFVDQGLSGKDLDLRMRHAMITDPDEMANIYLDAAMKSSGLTGIFEKGQTIEKAVVDYVGRHVDSKLAQGASKLVMRMLVGFPTATGNFIWQSGKRLTLGVPSYIESGIKAARGDKMGAALAFERGLKETGSGAAMFGLGVALGSSGMISGAYPTDPDERERWAREGISENSIKIGGAWYPIPQGAGMFGLSLLTGASVGRDGEEGLKEMFTRKNLAKLLPSDQIQGALNTLTDNGESPQAMKNMFASSVRGATPVGALLNQISKSFDETKNDTTTKDFWSNVLDQVYSGIPGVNNAMNIPDKTDKEGNVITNPNAAELALGATSNVQGGGEQRSGQINQEINSALSQIDKYGLLGDKNLDGVLEGSGLEAFNKANSGKQLDESEVKALKEGLVKGVSQEGTDTAYLEREQYDTNLAVLRLKRDLMAEDPTIKPSSLKDIDTAITRGEVYKDNDIPYKMITDYMDTSLTEWRDMGDPEDDDYNPEMYEKLWAIDELMTKAKVSDNYKGDMEKRKYSAKTSKGRGGRGRGRGGGSRQIDTSFGVLKDMSFTPNVQGYESIAVQSGAIPHIAVKRPNIVHKITSSG